MLRDSLPERLELRESSAESFVERSIALSDRGFANELGMDQCRA